MVHPNRRQFLGTAAATFAAPAFLRGRNLNDKLRIACVGVGGRGGSNLQSVSSEEIVGICDVYEGAIERAAANLPHARKTLDFRRLFDHANEFDAVVVSTTEHTHAFATLPALQLGKHVYCEKPLTHDVYEARVIREAANKAKVATQMGTQIHAENNYRRVVELIQSGAIGGVTEVHVWVGRAWGWQSDEAAKRHGDIVSVRDRPAGSSPIPKGLDWDLWLGPVPSRPFHEVYFPGPKWYRWWDFGNGTMSDLGSHWIDLPFWALKLQSPKTIEASGPPAHPEIAPASMRATYEYGPRGDMPALKLTWYQGEEKPRRWIDKEIPQWGDGVLFVGSKGMLLSDYSKNVLLPEGDFKDFQRPAPTIPASLGHHAEWIHACKTGAPTTCNFEYAGWLTEANHLGNVAYRTGKKLEWDAAALKATNAPEAAPLPPARLSQGVVAGMKRGRTARPRSRQGEGGATGAKWTGIGRRVPPIATSVRLWPSGDWSSRTSGTRREISRLTPERSELLRNRVGTDQRRSPQLAYHASSKASHTKPTTIPNISIHGGGDFPSPAPPRPRLP